jgi:hypothetical protein
LEAKEEEAEERMDGECILSLGKETISIPSFLTENLAVEEQCWLFW